MTFARPTAETRAAQRAAERDARTAALVAGARGMHRGTYSGEPKPTPKSEPMLQHAGYMEAVRSLGYCMRCRICCRPQFCHADRGKGLAIKTDVRRGWPGCPECHYLVGTSGYYPKEERRALEDELGRRTRQALIAAGTWPARVPMWKEEEPKG